MKRQAPTPELFDANTDPNLLQREVADIFGSEEAGEWYTSTSRRRRRKNETQLAMEEIFI